MYIFSLTWCSRQSTMKGIDFRWVSSPCTCRIYTQLHLGEVTMLPCGGSTGNGAILPSPWSPWPDGSPSCPTVSVWIVKGPSNVWKCQKCRKMAHTTAEYNADQQRLAGNWKAYSHRQGNPSRKQLFLPSFWNNSACMHFPSLRMVPRKVSISLPKLFPGKLTHAQGTHTDFAA